MDDINKISKKINRLISDIQSKCSDGTYIFRGTHHKCDEVNSALYRKWKEQEKKKKLEIFNEHYFPIDIEKDIVERARKNFPMGTKNIDIVAELQHYGAAATIVSFTHNVLIALFFACYGNAYNQKNGKLVMLNIDDMKKSDDIDYRVTSERLENKIISCNPAGASKVANAFQSSVFLHLPKGVLDDKEFIESHLKIRIIKKSMKQEILEFLRKYHGITMETVFNDLHGFILNEESHSTAQSYFYQGSASAAAGDNDAAKEYYQKALECNPEYVTAYYHQANMKLTTGDIDAAIIDYDKALELNPQYSEAYNKRGVSKMTQGMYESAILDYDKALLYDSKYAEAYNNRGFSKAKKNLRESAIADYDEALKLNPEYVQAYYNRANSKLIKGDNEAAIIDYTRVLEIMPNYPEAHNNRGIANFANKNYDEAITDYNEALKIDSKYVEAYYNRGNAKLSKKEYKDAILDFEKALKINSKYVRAYNNIGNARQKLGDYEGAILAFEKALGFNPKHVNAYFNRGMANYMLKKHEEAILDFEKVIELETKNTALIHRAKTIKEKCL